MGQQGLPFSVAKGHELDSLNEGKQMCLLCPIHFPSQSHWLSAPTLKKGQIYTEQRENL